MDQEIRAYQIKIEQLEAEKAQYKADIIKAAKAIYKIGEFLGLSNLSDVPAGQRTGRIIKNLMQKVPLLAMGGNVLEKIGINPEDFSDIMSRYKDEIEQAIKE